ncbi:MAG: translation initiation factor IF-2 N-terminal domain-containing protein, partial [Thermoguttaceae bacterium]
MSIRIYALAKQLKIENGRLIEICNQIGITGKGSALASLSDEEVAQIKTHLECSKGRAASTAAPGGQTTLGGAVLPRREDSTVTLGAASRKVPVLERKPEKTPLARKPAAGATAAHAAGPELEPEQVELAPAASPEDTATPTFAPRTGATMEATVVAPVVPDVSVHVTHAPGPTGGGVVYTPPPGEVA